MLTESRHFRNILLLVAVSIGGPLIACTNDRVVGDLPLEDDVAAPHRNPDGTMKPSTGTSSSSSSSPNDPPGSSNGPVVPPDAGAVVDGGSGSNNNNQKPPPSLPQPVVESFKQLDVRYPVGAALFVTQCTADAKTRLVWKTTAQGRDPDSRWADPAYPEPPSSSCGAMTGGHYPIVFTAFSASTTDLPDATWVARCVGSGQAHVYRTSGSLDGHPIAVFQYPESYPACP